MFSEKGISLTTELSPVFYYSKKDQLILEVNKEFERLYGESSKIIGRPLDEIFQPIWKDDFTCGSEEREHRIYVFLKVGKIVPGEVVIIETERNGEPVWLGAVNEIFPFNKKEETEKTISPVLNKERDILFLTDDWGKLLKVNEEACLKLGYSKTELLNMSIFDISHSVSRSYIREKWKKFIRREKAKGEYLFKRSDGEILYTECRAVANVREGLHLIVLRMIGNVTAEEKLEDKRKSKSIESSFNGVVYTDSELRLKYVNETCLEIFGFDSQEDMLGRPMGDFCKESDTLLEIKKSLQVNEEWNGKITAVHRDGSEVKLRVKIVVSPNGNEESVIWQGDIIDVTDKKGLKNLYYEVKNGLTGYWMRPRME